MNKKQTPEERRAEMQSLIDVALGKAPADLAVTNADLVNVYSGEIQPGKTILVRGERIAAIVEDGADSIGPDTRVIDAAGRTVIPGLIDGHTHIDNPYTPGELTPWAVAGGVTSIITEVDEIAFHLGYDGIIQFLRDSEIQPINIYIVVPPMVSVSPSSEEHGISVSQLKRLLKRDDVVGLGESYWAQVNQGHQRVFDLIEATLAAGKVVDGHTAGARGRKLQAYVSTGVTSCHEPISADEVRERLRLGLYIPIREGEVRRDLDVIAQIKDEGLDLSRLILSTDGVDPRQLVTEGYLDCVVRKAIELGFEPVEAIKMATLNPAQRFGLDRDIGGIAPGKQADMVIVPDVKIIKAECVISRGRLLYENGRYLAETARHTFSARTKRSIKYTRKFTAADFRVPVETKKEAAQVRVIDQVTPLVTREAIVDMPVAKGELRIDTGKDLLKVSAIGSRYLPGKTFTGFIRGYGLKSGAVAASNPWDSNIVIVVGASETDMALAVNRIRELNGGVVACSGEEVLAELALPIGGVTSEEPMETLAEKIEAVQQAAAGLGFQYPELRITLSVMATAAIPFIRICENGLFSVDRNAFVDLVL